MKIKANQLLFIIPVFLFGGIFLTQATGLWNTESTKTPQRIQDNVENPYDPQSISGSYTLQEVSDFYSIPVSVLYEAFLIDPTYDPTVFKSKDIESLYSSMEVEIGNESLQAFVAIYQQLPFELVDVYLPRQAVDILLAYVMDMPQNQKDYLSSHSIEVTLGDPNDVILDEETEESEENLISGPTTIQQVLDMGMTLEEFESLTGAKVGFTNQTVKDFCIEKGLSFGEIKVTLSNALNP